MRVGVYIEPIIQQQAGIHQFTVQLANALAAFGQHQYVLIGSKSINSTLEQIVVSRAGVSLLHVSRWMTKDLITEHRLDCFIDPSHFGSLGLLPAKHRIAIVHDITPLLFPRFHRWRTYLSQRVLMKSWIERSKHTIAISHQTESDIRTHLQPRAKITHIYPGVNISKETTDFVSRSKRYMLSVGTAEPRKNIYRVIEAFEGIEHPDFDLVIVGPKGWKMNLQKRVANSRRSSQIKLLGFVDRNKLEALYQKALALIYPSLYEGFGFPIVEAMLHGCPVITSDLSAMKEVASESAFLVNPYDVVSIQNAMFSLSQNSELRSNFCEKGKDRAKAFTWSGFVSRLESEVLA
ncbi:MAG: glycosyltransferase family 1 protein [Salibacteraceae bacterium]